MIQCMQCGSQLDVGFRAVRTAHGILSQPVKQLINLQLLTFLHGRDRSAVANV